MILSLTIALPIFSACVIMLLSNSTNQKVQKDLKIFALLVSIAELVSVLSMYYKFYLNICYNHRDLHQYHFVERYSWISSYNIEYFIGLDGISIYFILLTAILIPLCLLASWKSIKEKTSQYFALFLLIEGIIIGFFSSIDLVMFYLFFEASLVPMFFIIGGWGGENKIYATFKFFLYTFFASVFMLIAIIYIIYNCGSGDISQFAEANFNIIRSNKILWLGLFAAFAVKIPIWPLHTWLPDAHVQAPTGGSVILAGILLKMGGYGMLRVLLPLMPDLSINYFGDTIQIISIIAIIYGSLVALAQVDMKKMIAYSSIAHMGYVTAGIFTKSTITLGSIAILVENTQINPSIFVPDLNSAILGISGAMMQMISHGIISAALFLIVGMLYERTHTKEIAAYGGLARKMPILSAFFMVFLFGSIGLPGTSGFIGEFMVIIASFGAKPLYSFLIATGMVLGAVYMLFLYRKIVFCDLVNSEQGIATKVIKCDLNSREIVILLILAILTLFIGIYPQAILPIINNDLFLTVFNYPLIG